MRRSALARLAAVLALAGWTAGFTAGCTAGPTAEVPSAGQPTASAGDSSELGFVRCMRQQGIADMPDPVPGDTSGRSSVRYALDVLGKGSDEAFQTALGKCQNLLPTVEVSKQASSAQQQRDLAFGKCMRDHGVSEFPDDIPYSNGSPVIFFTDAPDNPKMLLATGTAIAVNLGNPTAKAAFDACQADWLKTTS
jgi:hypothetical protein